MERRLAAILAADVVGYSRLMRSDEGATLAALRQLRTELFEPVVASHNGQVIKRLGDGWLIEFTSAVEAVNCALEVQRSLDGHPVIKLRIGVHVGDIVHEDEDVYGDGVNIAARLQEICAPGGIAISGFTYESVKGAIGDAFREVGARHLKNIDRPVVVHVWGAGVNSDGALVTPDPAMASKPSVLVLPFSAAGDGQGEWLAEGLSDAVITALSRFSYFLVLPRNTAFSYKNRKASIVDLRDTLGVDYVLDGNLRASGPRVRVSAQLLDTKSGSAIWTDRFDGLANDPFDMEDQITRAIMAELTPRILGAEARRASYSEGSGAWDLVMRGRALLWHVNETDVAEALSLFQQAAELDPESGLGQADLAWCRIMQSIYGWGDERKEVLDEATRAAERAMAADPHDAFALTAAATVMNMVGRCDDAVALARRAVELNPYLAPAQAALALALMQRREYEAARKAGDLALALSPRDPLLALMLAIRGTYLMMLDEPEALAVNAQDLIREFPGMPTGYRQLAVAHALAGRLAEARIVVEDQILRLIPGHTATESGRQVPFGPNEEARQRWVDLLIKAGLPKGC